MSKTSLTDDLDGVKSEPPPIVAMLRRLEDTMAERDRLTGMRLRTLCRIPDGSGAANAA